MNVVFEGISGSGKTTLIENLKKELDKENEKYTLVPDLTYDTPLKPILLDLVNGNMFMNEEQQFKTSIYESLLLAANHHYVQEKLRYSDEIVIYDRDVVSVLAMQKEIIKKQYSNWKEFYNSYRNMMLFNLKNIDYLFLIDTPLDVCVSRTENRDNKVLTKEDIEMLKIMKMNMEEESYFLANNYDTDLTIINGNCDSKNNIKIIKEKILKR